VSVVVPFAGSESELELLLGRLAGLDRVDGDELIVADNRPGASARGPVIDASGIRTPGFARNRGARLATREWLVFIDADTRPVHSLLDAYFDPWPASSTAVVAGAIVDVAERPTLVARYTAKRSQMNHRTTLERAGPPYAQTANCAVRRSAFAAATGFDEQARAGEDADLCFRLAMAGWQLEHRPAAIVTHRARETIGAMVRQLAVHGSGAAWLNRRHPGSFPPPQIGELGRRLARDAVSAAATALSGERTQAADAILDLLAGLAFESGRLLPNARAAAAG
jgi:hypothetical protein